VAARVRESAGRRDVVWPESDDEKWDIGGSGANVVRVRMDDDDHDSQREQASGPLGSLARHRQAASAVFTWPSMRAQEPFCAAR
jgi:hypothetical protein